MTALQEVAMTAVVALSPIWISCLIGTICWGISYNKRRKKVRR